MKDSRDYVLDKKPQDELCEKFDSYFKNYLQKKILPYCKERNSGKSITLFISYAWAIQGSPSYKKDKTYEACVLKIATDLEVVGFKVHYDQQIDHSGHQQVDFLEKALFADFFLPIGTRLYLEKYKKPAIPPEKEHMVKSEGHILSQIAVNSPSWENKKIIPLLLEDIPPKECLPSLLVPLTTPIVFTNQDYFERFLLLIRVLYGIDPNDIKFKRLEEEFFQEIDKIKLDPYKTFFPNSDILAIS